MEQTKPKLYVKRGKSNQSGPGELASSATQWRGAIPDAQGDTEQATYLFQKDLQANTSKTPKDVANMAPS